MESLGTKANDETNGRPNGEGALEADARAAREALMPLSPGPWRWGYVDEDGDAYAEDSLMDGANQPLGFYNEGPNARGKSAENRANRAAIAAVPEMVELLTKVVERAEPVTKGIGPELASYSVVRFSDEALEHLRALLASLRSAAGVAGQGPLQRLQQSEKEG